MKNSSFFLTIILFILGTTITQGQSSSFGLNENKKIINNKKFHVVYTEVAIDKTVDEVWNEVSGNFMNVADIVDGINYTQCLSGDLKYGLGAERLCNLDFQGKTIEIKERIVDFKECGDHRELTYDVYESTSGPVKTYGTWLVTKKDDGKTYLGLTFMIRAHFTPLTGLVAKKLEKTGIRSGVLAYKHYLETGEKKVAADKLNELYPL